MIRFETNVFRRPLLRTCHCSLASAAPSSVYLIVNNMINCSALLQVPVSATDAIPRGVYAQLDEPDKFNGFIT